MESESFLNNIRSKHILKQVFSYIDFKSFSSLIKYNKSLQKKLDINFKNYYFNNIYAKRFETNGFNYILNLPNIIIKAIMLVFFLIYIILFYVKGSFIDEIIKANCDKNKIKFIEIMNNSLIGYLIFLLISILWYTLCLSRIILFKVITKLRIFMLILLIDIFYYILLYIKYNFSKLIIFDIIRKDQNYKFVDSWFINLDFLILTIIPIYYIAFIFFIFSEYKCNFDNLEDSNIITLNEFKGVKNCYFEIQSFSKYLNDKEINNLIIKNARNCKYRLNEDQIDLIKKINEIRRKNDIPLLKYDENERIPHCIINEVTEVVLYNEKNNFKLKNFLYLFRYKKNEFKNFIENDEVLRVINNDLLNKIKIIEQNDTEYILIYNTSSLNNKKKNLNIISYNTNENLISSNRGFINV